MRMRVAHAADAVYLNLTDRPTKDSAEAADYIVGVGILHASRRAADLTALKQFTFEEA
jgi:hypothetical protein